MTQTLVAPAFLSVPPRVGSYGDEAIDLARLVGRELDAEQQLAVDAMLSYGPGGKWAAFESAVIEARQNGKTGGVLLPVVLFDLFALPPDRIMWTAHLFRTARDAFMDFIGLIRATPELDRRVNKFTFANGEESIELLNGAKLEFVARSKGGGRGLGGKRLVMDEALFLSAESMGALIPTLAARSITGDPQINYGASAGLGTSDHLRNLRDRGRAGGDQSLVWVEWASSGSWLDPGCAEGPRCAHTVGTEGCSLDDETQWPLANPALGRRISYEYIRNERRALPVEEFGRERMGWWDEPTAGALFSAARWAELADGMSEPRPPFTYGIDVSADRVWATLAVAGYRPDGAVHVAVQHPAKGTDWVTGYCRELAGKYPGCRFVLDSSGPVSSLLPDLQAAGLGITELKSGDVRKACGMFVDAVTQGTVRHRAQQVLTKAVEGVQPRPLGDGGFAFGRKASTTVDISPLNAACWAHYATVLAGPGDVSLEFA